ncbi:MAG TPA: GNAT family N-acetyltransferase [Chloroflexota bacterium]|nr:GNAT family N-acetyltransferase [Chloroflexota bacterium]
MLLLRSLTVADAAELGQFLRSQPEGYLKFFDPFRFDLDTLERLLTERRRDCWMGVWGSATMIAFFMLRGFDEGYATPSYGVVVDAGSRGLGIGRLTVIASKSMCRLMGVSRIMLKVHPSNRAARALYESEGFVETAIDTKNGNLIYHFELVQPGRE